MTAVVGARRTLPIVDAIAPARRLAAFRIAAGLFTLGYLAIRAPVFLELTDRSASRFEGVGVLAPLDSPIPDALVVLIVALTLVSGVGVVVGAAYRFTAPAFAVGMLLLASFRGSWGQLLHFENLMVLHLIVLAFAPAADAWSIDARGIARRRGPRPSLEPSVRYGWPLAVAGLVTVITYVIAGVAKLRYGGFDWIAGDTLRNHVAYSATRLDLIGGTTPVLAEFAVSHAWALSTLAAVAVAIELAAPVAFLGGRVRNGWVLAAWLMHMSIFLTMAVGFPSPLFGLAFAPFYALERAVPQSIAGRLGD